MFGAVHRTMAEAASRWSASPPENSHGGNRMMNKRMRRAAAAMAAPICLAATVVLGSASGAHASSYGSEPGWELGQQCNQSGTRVWDNANVPVTQLEQGSEGVCVAYAQQMLANSDIPGYDTSQIDGQFGPKTEAAVRTFQSNLAQSVCGPVDGTIGPRTWFCLIYQN
jgi:hypothetical protein